MDAEGSWRSLARRSCDAVFEGRPALAFVGAGLWVALFMASGASGVALLAQARGAAAVVQGQAVFLVACVGVLAVQALPGGARTLGEDAMRRMAWAAAAAAGAAACMAAAGAPEALLATIAPALAGAAAGLIARPYAALYARLAFFDGLNRAIAALLAASLLFFALRGLPTELYAAGCAAVAACAAAALCRGLADGHDASGMGAGRADIVSRGFARMVAAMAVNGLIWGLAFAAGLPSFTEDGFADACGYAAALSAVCSAAALLLFPLSRKAANRTAVYYMWVNTLFVVTLTCCLGFSLWPLLFAGACHILAFFSVLAAHLSSRSGLAPKRGAILAFASVPACYGAGVFAGYLLASVGAIDGFVVVAVGVALATMNSVFVFPPTTIRAMLGPWFVERKDDAMGDVQKSMRRYMLKHGLSEREIDVALLILRGRTARSVGDALCISESTVRSHLHTIYSKLGVSSKQEMKELFSDSKTP